MLSCPPSQPAGEGQVNNWDTHKLQPLQDVGTTIPEVARGAEAISLPKGGKRYMLCIFYEGPRQKALLG